MALFKSEEERRIERDIKIRQGIRRIEKAVREQNKFAEEFIQNARRARQIGDDNQYQFIRNSLRKTATMKRLLERQLLAIKNALLIKRQAEAGADFAQSMGLMASEIGKLFAKTDLAKTQADWEKAMIQSQSMEERMDMFLDSVEDIAASDVEASADLVSEDDVDRMIEADAEAEHAREMSELSGLRAELQALKKRGGEKQK